MSLSRSHINNDVTRRAKSLGGDLDVTKCETMIIFTSGQYTMGRISNKLGVDEYVLCIVSNPRSKDNLKQ